VCGWLGCPLLLQAPVIRSSCCWQQRAETRLPRQRQVDQSHTDKKSVRVREEAYSKLSLLSHTLPCTWLLCTIRTVQKDITQSLVTISHCLLAVSKANCFRQDQGARRGQHPARCYSRQQHPDCSVLVVLNAARAYLEGGLPLGCRVGARGGEQQRK